MEKIKSKQTKLNLIEFSSLIRYNSKLEYLPPNYTHVETEHYELSIFNRNRAGEISVITSSGVPVSENDFFIKVIEIETKKEIEIEEPEFCKVVEQFKTTGENNG